MASKPGRNPWDYIVGGIGLAMLSGLCAIVGLSLIAWLAGLLAGLVLLIGAVAQGVRVGLHAHADDQQSDRYADDSH